MLKNHLPRIALFQSHYVMWALLCAFLFVASKQTLAEGGCPSGYAPSGVGPGGVQGCAPLPGSSSGTSQEPAGVWEDRYGAIATDDVDGFVGTANNARSKREAERTALADCQSKGGTHCGSRTWYRNGCGAMAVGEKQAGFSTASSLEEAKESSLKTCSEKGDSTCKVFYTDCAFPQRVR